MAKNRDISCQKPLSVTKVAGQTEINSYLTRLFKPHLCYKNTPKLGIYVYKSRGLVVSLIKTKFLFAFLRHKAYKSKEISHEKFTCKEKNICH